jgi:hypothetical protein
MRIRYALISLVGLLTGCQSLCPLRHMQTNPANVNAQTNPANVNAPLAQTQPSIANMTPPAPLTLDQPAAPQTMLPRTP